MTALARDRQLAVVAEAARAPSAHNTQPVRWRFTPDGVVLFFEDVERRLTVGDPTGRDRWIGIGCALEGTRLALSREGLALGPAKPPAPGDPLTLTAGGATLRLVARARIEAGAAPDELAAQVTARRTYRGRFLPASAMERETLRAVLDAHREVITIYDPREIAALARLADQATFRLLAHHAYQAELYRWIRFSPDDPAWARDGLTANCLGLSRFDRLAGRWLFAPPRFRRLARFGLHGPLVGEAGRTRTATALAIIHRPLGPMNLEPGRRFYRLWLEITHTGFDARPMSALVDDAAAIDRLHERHGVPGSSAPVSVFAIGKASPAWRAVSPRLPARELLV